MSAPMLIAVLLLPVGVAGLVIKENRTCDQVFGDRPQGSVDPGAL